MAPCRVGVGDAVGADGEIGGDRGDERWDDVSRPSAGLGDEHDCGEWDLVAGAEDRSDAEDREQTRTGGAGDDGGASTEQPAR